MTGRASLRIASLLLAGVVASASSADAQYFGRNKVQYRTFQFRVLATEHFDVYYYPEEEPAARMIGRMAERWLARLSQFFDHELRGRQSVILYASTGDFKQTNAVEGLIGEGTGGVTEMLKRRIIVPMAGSIAGTDHVLGHELVHAFQFDMTGVDPHVADRLAPGILAYPLWFVEGMAEYLSIGPVDAQTAMWLRDAAVTGRLPSLKDLDNPKFFPYRWGEAFWAYVGARWGDRQIASLLRSAANPRFDLGGMAAQLGTDPDTLTKDWHQAIREAEQVVERDRPSIGSQARRVLAQSSGAGRINVGPRLSPDGRKIAFFSERDKFSIDLYLADAETGRIEQKLVRTSTDPHFDSLQFLNSAGAWSPDGKTIALAVARNGKPALALIDARSGDIRREFPLAGLSDALGPTWAPDGQAIVFSGNSGGFTDLFRFSPGTGALDRLTDDPYADLEPVFTPDGRSIVFVTERFSTNLATLETGPLRLARLDLATHEIIPISAFLTGKHLSPQVSADGRVLTFIAEPDGVSNLYRMAIDGGPIDQLSSVLTGIAGITASSPALSMAAGTGRLAFSQFERDGDAIYILDPADIVATVAPASSARAAVLPPRAKAEGTVYGLVRDAGRGLPAPDGVAPSSTYTSKLKLDLVGQPTVSAGYNEWGSVVGGSVSAQFSDMLGDRVLGLGAEVSGTLDDLGGQMIFLNRRHRWNFGVEVEQTPYRVDFLTVTTDPVANLDTVVQSILRLTSRGVFGLAQYPINPVERFEFTAGARHLTLTQEDRTETFEDSSGTFLGRTDVKTPLGRDGRGVRARHVVLWRYQPDLRAPVPARGRSRHRHAALHQRAHRPARVRDAAPADHDRLPRAAFRPLWPGRRRRRLGAALPGVPGAGPWLRFRIVSNIGVRTGTEWQLRRARSADRQPPARGESRSPGAARGSVPPRHHVRPRAG
jgi:hypothetical protein